MRRRSDSPPVKVSLGIDVLTAARQRVARVFEDFPRIYVSFSGGKDSTAMLHLVMEQAIARNRKVGVLFVDLEGQYRLTINHVAECFERYAPWIDPYWLALPLNLRNAVSQFQPQWRCWDPAAREDWIRDPHPSSLASAERFPFFIPGMEFEDFVLQFGEWYACGDLCACFVGIRTVESLNRWRSIAGRKRSFEGLCWTTRVIEGVYNIYPIYDWKTEDIWVFFGREKLPYNRLYDRMHAAGLTIHQQRICQPYGDDQRKGLWLFSVIEPETWARVVARVNGANQGALYAQQSGNILGRIKINKPAGHTWQSFCKLLLESLPPRVREHYEDKIAVFLRWYQVKGFQQIPDAPSEELNEQFPRHGGPSWMRIAKALLRNDYWCKGLSFSQHKTEAYEKYSKLMKRRRESWGIF